MSHSITAKLGRLQQVYRHRQARRSGQSRTHGRLSRRRIGSPETLECRTLLAADMMAADVPGEPFPDSMFVQGVKWEDVNDNGFRDQNEPGLGGVTIYSDINGDGRFSDDEPFAVTNDDGGYELQLRPGEHFIAEVVPSGFQQTFPGRGPFGEADADGDGIDADMNDADMNDVDGDRFATVEPSSLRFGGSEPVEVSLTVHPFCIRPFEVSLVPSTAELSFITLGEQTKLNGCGGDTTSFSVLLLDAPVGRWAIQFVDGLGGGVLGSIPVFAKGGGGANGHFVFGEAGDIVEGIDFGNHRELPPATVHGQKWLDTNTNGVRDNNESGLAAVTIFADLNHNGFRDRNEPSTVTMRDDPATDFDEAGMYWLEGVPPGAVVIREVIPDGFAQTFPGLNVDVRQSELGAYERGAALDLTIDGGTAIPSDDSDKVDVSLDFTVLWRDGCGVLDANQSVAAVIGNTIAVELHGYQAGTVCTEALQSQSVTVDIGDLSSDGPFNVIATLHEDLFVDDGKMEFDIATLIATSAIHIGGQRGHRLQLVSGESIADIDFGNYRLPPGEVRGTKWNDVNGNGQRDGGEHGLAGVTIYSDTNLNGVHDDDEPFTVTRKDDPATDFDEGGMYVLTGLAAGPHWIKEIVPDGYQQTFPYGFFLFDEFPDDVRGDRFIPPPFPDQSGWHDVWIEPGGSVEGIDFGNQKIEPGSIHGTKWNDLNGNGIREDNEPGLSGVMIYVDTNYNGAFDGSDPFAISMRDDPNTDVDETGKYWIKNLRPGQLTVREVVPNGYVQTFPSGDDIWIEPWIDDPAIVPPFYGEPGAHHVYLNSGGSIDGLDFGNQKAEPGRISGIKWLDENGNRRRDPNEQGLAGVTIYIDANNNFALDDGELSAVTMRDDPDTRVNETGRYSIDNIRPGFYNVREIVPDGYVQTFPEPLPRPIPLGPFDGPVPPGQITPYQGPGDSSHFVQIRNGGHLDGLDFGNRKYEPAQVHGTKWNDINGNGQRDLNEPGLPGVIIYADVDFDGRFSEDFEPHTRTMRDDPNTDFDEAGMYWLEDLSPGSYVIREVVPQGFQQTFPYSDYGFPFPTFPVGQEPVPDIATFPIPYPDDSGGHYVYLEVGAVVEGLDFGNREVGVRPSSIEGRKWRDDNGNGRPDPNEPGLAGVTIYIDANNNSRLDANERRTLTSRDNPDTDFDEGGRYSFSDVVPGRYTVREVVPDGFEQTYPIGAGGIKYEEAPGHPIRPIVVADFAIVPDFSLAPISTNVWFQITMGGCASFDANATKVNVGGREIFVDLVVNSVGHEAACDAALEEIVHPVHLGGLAAGEYSLRASLSELNTDGSVHESFVAETHLVSQGGSNAHTVFVSEDQGAVGVDFGNQRIRNGTGVIQGVVWHDENANGRREDNESAIRGAVFIDANLNGQFDADDPVTEMIFPGLTERFAPFYRFSGLEPGFYVVRAVPTDTFRVTFPNSPITCLAVYCTPDSHHITIAEGDAALVSADFGLARTDVPMPGDANIDGRVDGIDLSIWRANRFKPGDWTRGDFTGDGMVDGSDFNYWVMGKFQQRESLPARSLTNRVPRAPLSVVAAVTTSPVALMDRATDKDTSTVGAYNDDTAERSIVGNVENGARLGDHVRARSKWDLARRNRFVRTLDAPATETDDWSNRVDLSFAAFDDF